jgi:hypothetical protein
MFNKKEPNMPNGHRADIAKLVNRVHALSDAIVGVGTVAEWKNLIVVFHRPGWTTPAEFRFAMGMVDAMIVQARALRQLKTGLFAASRAVSRNTR